MNEKGWGDWLVMLFVDLIVFFFLGVIELLMEDENEVVIFYFIGSLFVNFIDKIDKKMVGDNDSVRLIEILVVFWGLRW